MKYEKIFVYGTLKPGYGNYEHFIGGRDTNTQAAMVYGRIYDLGGFPATTKGFDTVYGYYMEVPETLMPALDMLEGVEAGLYYRKQVKVFSRKDLKLMGKAWVYFMEEQQAKQSGSYIANGNWEKEYVHHTYK